jgi:hypothetical protein
MINKIFNFFIKIKKVNLKTLPSMGLFYKEGFEIKIKKASKKNIEEYESNYSNDDIGTVIYYIKKIVENNIILPKNFKFIDIKSIDVIFLFLEIVKFTKDKSIFLNYYDNLLDRNDKIEFCPENFNYFQLGNLMDFYDYKKKCFFINDYKYTLPTIGVENSLTNFLIIKSSEEGSSIYNDYNYDFTHFVGHKNHLSYKEIENLIQIFNFDLDDSEMRKVRSIIESFSGMLKYSLSKDGKLVEMTSKINLQKIWR